MPVAISILRANGQVCYKDDLQPGQKRVSDAAHILDSSGISRRSLRSSRGAVGLIELGKGRYRRNCVAGR